MQHREASEQIALFQWAKLNENKYPELQLLHSPNPLSAKLTPAQAGRAKAMGYKAGIPDIFLPVPIGNFCGLFIEMKAPSAKMRRFTNKGCLNKAQKEFLPKLQLLDYQVHVVYSWCEAAYYILCYLINNLIIDSELRQAIAIDITKLEEMLNE